MLLLVRLLFFVFIIFVICFMFSGEPFRSPICFILMIVCLLAAVFCMYCNWYLVSDYVGDPLGYINYQLDLFFDPDNVCDCCNSGCGCNCHCY